jgi:hypothetical protein
MTGGATFSAFCASQTISAFPKRIFRKSGLKPKFKLQMVVIDRFPFFY